MADAWLVKPGENSNRGRGIRIFRSHEEVRRHIEEHGEVSAQRSFIIQRYITDLLLYRKRKFDLRCYVLVTCLNGRMKAYWYEEGYVRTASAQFATDDWSNAFVHLTNDAIQKHGPEYGRHEPGNKLALSELHAYV